ncbi:MAG: TIGR03790 family protein [Candidatus Omnitrophica bacterium]|nr:TIGR03790 family protein [Candidatus Omnitrophota bacterium]
MQFKHNSLTQKFSIFLCLQILLAICCVVESRAEIRKIVVTPNEQSGRIHSCLEYQITFLNEKSEVVPTQTDLEFKITDPSGKLQLFSSADLLADNCTGDKIDGNFTIPAGQSFRRILIKSTIPIESDIYFEGVNTLVPFKEVFPVDFIYTEPASLKFLTEEANPRPGLCTKIDFGYFDENGLPLILNSPLVVNFFPIPTPDLLFSDSACMQRVTEYEIAAGQSVGSIYTRVPPNFLDKIYIADKVRKDVMVLTALPLNYDDVGVVVNRNSAESRKIARYFVSQRNIPAQNVFYINAPTAEIISDDEFQVIRAQLEALLPAHNDPDHVINYLVTTKGLPLGIERDAHINSTSTSASVESEIALLAGPHANQIGLTRYFINPFIAQDKVFSRAEYGFFLVTRLDAYTLQGVLNLIDRSRPLTPVDVSASTSVFDRDPHWVGPGTALNYEFNLSAALMSTRGYPAELNTDTTYVTNRSNVLAYGSWGSNDHSFPWSIGPSLPMFTWVAGSIAETYVSTSARSLMPGTPYGQSLIADLILEGVCGVKGYVFEPLTSAMARMSFVTERYTRGYNLAESFSMGSYASLSWMEVIIGDPKMSIVPMN